MSKTQDVRFKELFAKVSKAAKDSPEMEEELVDLARDWGLPSQLAGSMDIVPLVRTVAAVSVISS